ncbi:PAS domain-containing protein, partial [Mycobacterium tuberculosis]|nr:PAS domain-containing protein [Mycobacterium tuberculosis]
VEFNDIACRDLGYSRAEFAGLTLADIHVSRDPEGLRRMLWQAAAGGDERFEWRDQHRRSDDSLLDVQVRFRFADLGEHTFAVCSWTDITR